MVPGQPQPQGQWQPQQVTLQQRGPMGGQPPHQIMGMRGPHPQRMPMDQQHPALMRQDPTPPPPPPFDPKPMTPPPENPQTDEERAHAVRYDQWLKRQEGAINDHLRHYETEISKLRKQRKVSSTLRYLRLYFPFSFSVQDLWLEFVLLTICLTFFETHWKNINQIFRWVFRVFPCAIFSPPFFSLSIPSKEPCEKMATISMKAIKLT